MTRTIECREAALLAFAHQRGELTPAQRAELRAHTATCAACATLVDRVDDLLDAAATWDPAEDPTTASADDLFARIEGAIDAAPAIDPAADALFDRIEAAIDADAAAVADLDGDASPASAGGTGARRVANTASDAHRAAPTAAESDAEDADDAAVVDLVDTLVRRRRAARAAAIVAVAVAVLALLVVVRPFGGAPTAPAPAPGDADAPSPVAADDPAIAPDPTPEAPAPDDESARDGAPTAPEAVIASLALDADAHGAVRVFASPGAAYTVSDGPDHVLALTEGAAVVEFVGDGTETLRVDVGDWSVRVVGTAFFVEAGDDPDVRVLTGAVEVTSPAGTSHLTDGIALDGRGPRAITAPERAALVARVDVDDHRAALRERRADDAAPSETAAASPTPPRRPPVATPTPIPTPTPTPTPGPRTDARDDGPIDAGLGNGADPTIPSGDPSESATTTAGSTDDPIVDPDATEPTPDHAALAAEARDRGRDAQRRRDWVTAADAFEASLAAEPSAPGAGTVRLDLARIYLRQLDDPERALPHLEAFVLAHPTDVAAPAARDELCRAAEALGREVALCAP